MGRVRLHAAKSKACGRAKSGALGLVLIVNSAQACKHHKHYDVLSGV